MNFYPSKNAAPDTATARKLRRELENKKMKRPKNGVFGRQKLLHDSSALNKNLVCERGACKFVLGVRRIIIETNMRTMQKKESWRNRYNHI